MCWCHDSTDAWIFSMIWLPFAIHCRAWHFPDDCSLALVCLCWSSVDLIVAACCIWTMLMLLLFLLIMPVMLHASLLLWHQWFFCWYVCLAHAVLLSPTCNWSDACAVLCYLLLLTDLFVSCPGSFSFPAACLLSLLLCCCEFALTSVLVLCLLAVTVLILLNSWPLASLCWSSHLLVCLLPWLLGPVLLLTLLPAACLPAAWLPLSADAAAAVLLSLCLWPLWLLYPDASALSAVFAMAAASLSVISLLYCHLHASCMAFSSALIFLWTSAC